MSTRTLTLESYQFMHAHAGYSGRPDEPAEAGRARCALALARAEYALARSGAAVEWIEDYDADTSWLDQTDAEMGDGFEAFARERKSAHTRGEFVFMGAILRDEDGETLASLWGIELATPFMRDPYRRVVEAELACEAGTLLDPSTELAERAYWASRDVVTIGG